MTNKPDEDDRLTDYDRQAFLEDVGRKAREILASGDALSIDLDRLQEAALLALENATAFDRKKILEDARKNSVQANKSEAKRLVNSKYREVELASLQAEIRSAALGNQGPLAASSGSERDASTAKTDLQKLSAQWEDDPRGELGARLAIAREALEPLLAHLEIKDAAILVLHGMGGYKQEEVADLIKIKQPRISQRFTNIKRKLGECLAPDMKKRIITALIGSGGLLKLGSEAKAHVATCQHCQALVIATSAFARLARPRPSPPDPALDQPRANLIPHGMLAIGVFIVIAGALVFLQVRHDEPDRLTDLRQHPGGEAGRLYDAAQPDDASPSTPMSKSELTSAGASNAKAHAIAVDFSHIEGAHYTDAAQTYSRHFSIPIANPNVYEIPFSFRPVVQSVTNCGSDFGTDDFTFMVPTSQGRGILRPREKRDLKVLVVQGKPWRVGCSLSAKATLSFEYPHEVSETATDLSFTRRSSLFSIEQLDSELSEGHLTVYFGLRSLQRTETTITLTGVPRDRLVGCDPENTFDVDGVVECRVRIPRLGRTKIHATFGTDPARHYVFAQFAATRTDAGGLNSKTSEATSCDPADNKTCFSVHSSPTPSTEWVPIVAVRNGTVQCGIASRILGYKKCDRDSTGTVIPAESNVSDFGERAPFVEQSDLCPDEANCQIAAADIEGPTRPIDLIMANWRVYFYVPELERSWTEPVTIHPKYMLTPRFLSDRQDKVKSSPNATLEADLSDEKVRIDGPLFMRGTVISSHVSSGTFTIVGSIPERPSAVRAFEGEWDVVQFCHQKDRNEWHPCDSAGARLWRCFSGSECERVRR